MDGFWGVGGCLSIEISRGMLRKEIIRDSTLTGYTQELPESRE